MVGLGDIAEASDSIKAFVAHWQSLGEGGNPPTSEAFLDHVEPAFQPFVSINDVHEDRRCSVALFGTALVELWKTDLTGKAVEEFLDDEQIDRLVTDFLLCAGLPCGIWEVSTLRTTTNRVIGWEMVTLPLLVDEPGRHRIVRYHNMKQPASNGEQVTRILHFQQKEWVDIGAGEPPQEPLKKAS